MKKGIKKLIVSLVCLLITGALLFTAWEFLLFPAYATSTYQVPEITPETATMVEFAEQAESIDYNEESGELYVNNEVIIYMKSYATQKDIDAFLTSTGAEIDSSMSDIQFYRLTFKGSMTQEELDKKIKDIQESKVVESAYVNSVTMLNEDTEEEFDFKDAIFPDDPWQSAKWNVLSPSGNNWGIEAIDAPSAWGYLDQLSTVNVGLIDSQPNKNHEDLSFKNVSNIVINDSTGNVEDVIYNIAPEDHGTHVSGTINAKWNNKKGVSGVMGGKGELHYANVYYKTSAGVSTRFGTAYSYLLALKNLIDQDVQAINISLNTSRLKGFAASRGNKTAIEQLTTQATLTEKGLFRIIENRKAQGKPDFVICVAAGNNNSLPYKKDSSAPYGYVEITTQEEYNAAYNDGTLDMGNSQAIYNNFLNLMDEKEVKDRVIVVGAVEIDPTNSSGAPRYRYTDFSNIGARVDVVAPGQDVYSCSVNGYMLMSGTSMATPHVTGVAGLTFAANPNLSGPEVKQIIVSTSMGRYYHGSQYSGMVNANNAVVTALQSAEKPVGEIITTQKVSGLDLCFVVDTTGSMGDDINNAKENMSNVLSSISQKTKNYRIALIDYRDFSDRTGNDKDYPCKLQLDFSNSDTAILNAINNLNLGNGGDGKETVYSALMEAAGLGWRKDAKKVIIILGDAAPLDPEPVTNYTFNDVLQELVNADIEIDGEISDERVTSALDISSINVYSIGTDASTDAADFFEEISGFTGGSYLDVEDASGVGDAIVESIEQIDIVESVDVKVSFGKEMANKTIHIYDEEGFLFTVDADSKGDFYVKDILPETYTWVSNGLYVKGSFEVDGDAKTTDAKISTRYWFADIINGFNDNLVLIIVISAIFIFLCIIIPIIIKAIKKKIQKKREDKKAPPISAPDAPQAPQPVVTAPQANNTAPVITIPQTKAAPTVTPPVNEAPPIEPLMPFTEPVDEKAVSTASASDTSSAAKAPKSADACPSCGTAVRPGSLFCGKCGAKLQPVVEAPAQKLCPSCGTSLDGNAKFCKACGTKLI